MAAQRKSTRQRLVQAALQLFAAQGVTETTTKQIAELADVNEVTLFRHFGSKHGLLLAVIEEAEVFTQLGEALGQRADDLHSLPQALQVYAEGHLQAIEQIPEFVRSLVGEAGHYPTENRQAIGRGLSQIHRYTAQYLATVLSHNQMNASEDTALLMPLSAATLASLMNALLLGYAVIEFTTEFHELWPDREAFIADLVSLFLGAATGRAGAIAPTGRLAQFVPSQTGSRGEILDLPAPLVREILQTARKSGSQDYALAYVLFGAGLSPAEMARMQRSHSISDDQQHLLHVVQGATRQVPLNQWIMGHRYGSYTKNPLTQWLRSRKDDQPALFINEAGRSMSEVEIRLRWQTITAEIIAPSGHPPLIEQAQQTWCVEMLMRGISLESLSILTGSAPEQLQPYVRRAQEKAALEQAIRLDQRSSIKSDASS
ncbi:TetR/AcrR family transcriptional regulator [Oculatella sp. LEGE 06141]|uniref:TetR/AcrR family transcriptional regulator n=1 Tax=Oculatella sp. LEGE 06141 TaxID=1828648 RepID=UPI0018812DEB|nr:TetR/AcrR family transcriptional regulator [Oculatella sp. LEGE 06141]MBE9181171.1 TetR/AcrR family transcriptional regulator [Oculatella sp. LEGE 06141]